MTKSDQTWTKADERHALGQGWSLFTVDSGDVVIQKVDDPSVHSLWQPGMPEDEVFDSDAAAIRFVRRQARSGDAIARKAIAVHDRNIARWRRWKQRDRRALSAQLAAAATTNNRIT